jgi:monoterpene epsilon-lactone hydrolase
MLHTIQRLESSTVSAEVVHPLVAADRVVMEAMRAQIEPFKGTMTGPEAREPYDAIIDQVQDAPGVRYEQGMVGGIAGVWVRPQHAVSGNVILYLHGGAYILGSAHVYRHLAGQIAARANADAFIPDYRRAPEAPFPAAVEDAWMAYRGLVDLGIRSIALAGDSAGGGLALAMLTGDQEQVLTHAGVTPRAVVALSPWTDLALTGPSLQERADDDPMLTPEMLEITASTYLQGHDPRDPQASPLYGRLVGLPPIQIHVGSSEILLDDSLRFVSRAHQEGVDVTAHVWEGMPHVFPTSVGTLESAGQALDLIGDFLRETFVAADEAGSVRSAVRLR